MYVSDLIRIVSVGGGLKLDSTKFSVSDLIRIADVAGKSKTKLILDNCSKMYVSDLVRIASAGNGSVVFNDLQ